MAAWLSCMSTMGPAAYLCHAQPWRHCGAQCMHHAVLLLPLQGPLLLLPPPQPACRLVLPTWCPPLPGPCRCRFPCWLPSVPSSPAAGPAGHAHHSRRPSSSWQPTGCSWRPLLPHYCSWRACCRRPLERSCQPCWASADGSPLCRRCSRAVAAQTHWHGWERGPASSSCISTAGRCCRPPRCSLGWACIGTCLRRPSRSSGEVAGVEQHGWSVGASSVTALAGSSLLSSVCCRFAARTFAALSPHTSPTHALDCAGHSSNTCWQSCRQPPCCRSRYASLASQTCCWQPAPCCAASCTRSRAWPWRPCGR